MVSFWLLILSDCCNIWLEVLVLYGLLEGVLGLGGLGGWWGVGEVLEGVWIGVIVDGVFCFFIKVDCRWICGVLVFDGYMWMVVWLMGLFVVLWLVSILKGYWDFGFGSLCVVVLKNCLDVSGWGGLILD